MLRSRTLEEDERTGCSVVAAGRAEDVLVELDGDFTFEAGDEVYVCGSVDATQEFLDEFPQ